MNDMIISAVRTGTAAVVAFLITLANDSWGVDVDTEAVTAAVMTIVFVVYYNLARILEQKFPAIRFLGLNSQPSYEKPAV